jgi:hypothetical protein
MTDRHTLSKAYQDSQDLLRAQATRPHAEPTSDVEVTRNAKGDWQFKVAVTDHDPNEAYRKASELAEALTQRFPFSVDDLPPDLKKQLEDTLADEVGAKRRGKPKT